jgi:hypothetical protein
MNKHKVTYFLRGARLAQSEGKGLAGKGIPVYALKACDGVKVQPYHFLTLALIGNRWSASRLDCFSPRGKSH